MKDRINRRDFIKGGATAGALVGIGADKTRTAVFKYDRNSSPAEKITLGFIGVGARAHQVMDDVLSMPTFEVVGLCDAYQGRIKRALERTEGRPKVYRDHRELLAAPGIDAVYIGTPDHWHKDHAIAALEAGKDVYLEKPLTYTISEGKEIIDAVKRTGKILQVGSQNISSPIQQRAREIIAEGRLGQITMIRASVNRNSAGGAWVYPIPSDANEKTVDWGMFLGSAPKRGFSLERFFRWRCYTDYSGGMATDLFVHLMTTIHYVMGVAAPEMVMAASSLYRWKDGRDVGDTINAILQYPEGFTVNLSGTFNNESGGEQGFQILGTKGSMTIGRRMSIVSEFDADDNGWIVDSWPSELQKNYYRDPKVIARERPNRWDPNVLEEEQSWRGVGRDTTSLHLESFVNAIKSRKQPVEDALAGHRAAAVPHMINLAAKQNRPVYWDRSTENLK
ncbi:MAG: twin-arginine translocation signal domain-containing protein [Acidobacteria bacterium]|nr:twin-arginine translocation signal domain-containing protein [Acidobacteriota bacterium]